MAVFGTDRSTSKTRRSGARKRKRRRIWIGLAATTLILAAGGGWIVLQPRALEVQTVPVVTTYLSQQFIVLSSTGRIVAPRKAAIASRAAGRLAWLGVGAGTRVKAGEVIGRLEAHDVTAALDLALADVRASRASFELAQAEDHDATVALSRTRDLVAKQVLPRSSLDRAEARADRAAASVASGSAGLIVAEASARKAQVAVEYTLIRAPFDGVILSRDAEVGDVVTPFSATAGSRGAVVSMADTSTLEVETDVPEASLSKIRVGQPAEITLDALPDLRLRGSVSRVVPTADRTAATEVANVSLDAIDPRVLPAMSAKVSFLSRPMTAEQQQPLVAVNSDALAERGGTIVVFVVRKNQAVEVPVIPGRKLADVTAIAGDVRTGERVVLKPAAELKGGTRVRAATQ